jgi:hypothetical protein
MIPKVFETMLPQVGCEVLSAVVMKGFDFRDIKQSSPLTFEDYTALYPRK